MLYSFMTFSTPTLTLAENIHVAKRFGYQGIEPRIDAKHAHGIEVCASTTERAALRSQAEKSGIKLCCLATSLYYANPAIEVAAIEQTHERIALAADMNIPVMRVFGGDFPATTTRHEAVNQVTKCLRAVADHAAERNVIVCLETHDSWCNPADVAAVLTAVNHSAIACNWDVMHPVRMDFATVEDSFNVLRRWIRHTHLHDGVTIGGSLRMVPIGEGEIDHKSFVRLLKESGFKGFLSGEWIGWESWETHLPRELATLKSYE